MIGGRIDAIGWSEYFLRIAELTALRSKAPNTQVGCVIASPDKKILSTGYNGMVRTIKGDNDKIFPWKSGGRGINNKNNFVVHAAANAVINATGSLKNARIFCTHFPCCECAKLICQSGIRLVYFSGSIDLDPDAESCELASTILFDAAGVKCKQMPPQL